MWNCSWLYYHTGSFLIEKISKMCRRCYNSKFNALINVLDMYMAVHEILVLIAFMHKNPFKRPCRCIQRVYQSYYLSGPLCLLSTFDGRGSRGKNHKALSITGPDPLKNHKATKPTSFPLSSTPPPLKNKNKLKKIRVGPPRTKFSGSAHAQSMREAYALQDCMYV